MIKVRTAFVVGAGASWGYGFPLGRELVTDLIQAVGPKGVSRAPLLRAGYRGSDLDDFAEKLRGSDSESIDTFLEGNLKPYVDIGKAAIALTILRVERYCRDNDYLLVRPPGAVREHEHADSHWLYHVWNLMRAGTTADTFGRNQVSFLVFNYDRTIERYFDTVLSASFNLRPEQATQLRKDSFRVIHLHGAIPEDQPFGNYYDEIGGERVVALAEGIQVIHSARAEGNRDFEDARQLLRESRVNCFLGFGYHELNIQRLGIQEMSDGDHDFYASAFGVGIARRNVAQGLMNKTVEWGSPSARSAVFLSEYVPLR